ARETQRVLAEDGWAAPQWPREFGGRGCSLVELMIWAEEKAAFHLPVGVFEIGLAMCGPTIMAHGTDEQRARYLPPLLRGDEIWCQLWSEPGAGSDLAGLSSRAERDDSGDWVLNGQKVWTSGAHYAQFGLGVFRSNPDVPKHKGITCLIVDMSAPGVEVRPLRQITGDAHFNEVFFTDAVVPAANVVGEVDGGWGVARTLMMFERAAVGGMTSPSRAIAPLLRLARRTVRDGGTAAEHAVLRQRLAELYIAGRLFDLTTARVRSALSKGGMPGTESSILKLAAAQLGTRAAETGLDVLGAGGALVGPDAPEGGRWADALLGAPALHIGGGTDNIQRNIIGEQVLGLPREPSTDRDVPFRDLPVAGR
ncbi:MAG TPA: acyl-CoA dehydrogenase family protein, partial [Egibacteraceae bacterium]|nr:acyl-CoA dehydrogenase family protein [Egibacteraceae bacterium]